MLVMIIVAPIVGGYLRMLSGLMGGMRINESIKKVMVLGLLITMGIYVNEMMYVMSFIYIVSGVLRGVLCGVYVFLTLGVGI